MKKICFIIGKILYVIFWISLILEVFSFNDGSVGSFIVSLIMSIILIGIAVLIYVTPRMKNYVVKFGQNIADFLICISFLIFASAELAGVYYLLDYEQEETGWAFILGGIVYLILSVLAYYFLHLIVDIRNSLKKLAYGDDIKPVERKIEEEPLNKKCPKCGAEIKLSAKKCRFCGEWIEASNNGEENNAM